MRWLSIYDPILTIGTRPIDAATQLSRDRFEPNDIVQQATMLSDPWSLANSISNGTVTIYQLSIPDVSLSVSDFEDWYLVSVPAEAVRLQAIAINLQSSDATTSIIDLGMLAAI